MIDGSLLHGLAWSAPWWLALVLTAWRWRGSPSLDDLSSEAPFPAPLVSVIVPARRFPIFATERSSVWVTYKYICLPAGTRTKRPSLRIVSAICWA